MADSPTPPRPEGQGGNTWAPTQAPRETGNSGGRGSTAPEPDRSHEFGYTSGGTGAAPSNGFGNKVPQ